VPFFVFVCFFALTVRIELFISQILFTLSRGGKKKNLGTCASYGPD
jgi:hypothetical protein